MKRVPSHLRVRFNESPSRQRRLNGAWLALAAILIAVPLTYYRQIVQDTVRLEQSSTTLAQQLVSPGVTVLHKDDGQGKLLKHLNAPWETLLNGLENAASDKATLLSMQPNLARGEAVLSGEAGGYSDVLDYIERLKAQPGFTQAYLTNHTIAEDRPGKPVRFAVTLQWEAAS
jgi:hypothetical protein